MEELKQEDWEVQDTFNEVEIEEIIDGGDEDETIDENTGEGE